MDTYRDSYYEWLFSDSDYFNPFKETRKKSEDTFTPRDNVIDMQQDSSGAYTATGITI